MKYNFTINEIPKETAIEMIQKYHYSNIPYQRLINTS